MTAPATFSLLDAARVVARGGDLDEKLRALSAQAALAAPGGAVVVLLLEPEAGLILTPDGAWSVPLDEAAAELLAAVQDRQSVALAGATAGLDALLPAARSGLAIPLVTEDEEGSVVQGLLLVGWENEAPPMAGASEPLLALADLAAVAVRQARLENTAQERVDHAERLAHTDRLTGLANRVTFERMLELEIARASRQGTPLAVVVLDVDGLTAITEEHGARLADEILRRVASAIAERVRLLDTVARFGPDEFVVIAPGDGGGVVALRLRDAVAELPPVSGISVSVSAAVVHHPADGATGGDLVAAAEAALDRARSSGPAAVMGVAEATS